MVDEHRESAQQEAIGVSNRLLAIPAPKHADLSPDGSLALVTVGIVAIGSDDEVFELCQISTVDGASTPVPGALSGDRYGVWSPDGSKVAWLTRRTGSMQVAVAHAGASPQIVSDLPVGASGPVAWCPDGSKLVVTAPARRVAIDRTQPYRLTRPTVRFDGIGWLDEAPQLWLIDLHADTGPAARQRLLTDDGWRWSAPSWSQDGSTVLATANHAPDAVGRATEVRIVHMDGSWRVADVPRSENATACWSATGQVVVVPARILGEGTGRKKDIWIERPGETATCRTASFTVGVGGTLYGDHAAWLSEVDWMAPIAGSTDLLVRFGDGGRHGVARVAMEGPESVTVVASGDRCLNPVAAVGDMALVVTESADSPCELAVLQISTGEMRTITGFAGDAVPPVHVRRFTVNAVDGPPIETWFVCSRTTATPLAAPLPLPLPLPTVLLVHGGPEAAFGEAFSIDVHVLCAAGFGVLYCNPRGSTGYGTEFSAAAVGEWGNAPVDDAMAALDHAVETGLADPARLGVCGASFGGWMASWLACTSNRFAAALAENPVTDLLSMSFTSDIGPEFMTLSMGGDVQTSLDRYLRWSPLLQAHRCRTPTLFVVGGEDDRVPLSQANELATALHRQRTATEILVLPGCSHAGASTGPVPGRRAQNDAMVDWFLRWLAE
jgi:dipeptidyl aminopeptidase/acylaminoacyl peptidase